MGESFSQYFPSQCCMLLCAQIYWTLCDFVCHRVKLWLNKHNAWVYLISVVERSSKLSNQYLQSSLVNALKNWKESINPIYDSRASWFVADDVKSNIELIKRKCAIIQWMVNICCCQYFVLNSPNIFASVKLMLHVQLSQFLHNYFTFVCF